MWACKKNNITHSVVKLLLATGNAHPEYQDTDGDSALILVCINKNLDIVKFLLDTGNAHPEYINNKGKTAFDYGNDSIKKCICIYIKTRKIMNKMILIIKL